VEASVGGGEELGAFFWKLQTRRV